MSQIARLLIPFALLLTTASVRADDVINVLTGGTSGVYYPMGVALSKIYGTAIPGVRVSVQATKASVDNLILLQQGKGEVAFTQGDTLAFARDGNEEVGFKTQFDGLRGIAGLYPSYIQISALKASRIRTLSDLAGKRLSVGAPKSGTELNARALLGAAGMSYGNLAEVQYLPFDESIEGMKNGRIDASTQTTGLGASGLRELAMSSDIVIVEIPAAIIERMGNPYMKGVIPAGTYRDQSGDVQTASIANFLVTRADMSPDIVYAMTKSLFEHVADLAAAHPAARAIDPRRALDGMPIPLHPGAQRYYREIGLLR
jgi:TRAP transporter TAXI family solute receptor